MRRGRPPKPVATHRAEGTFRQDRHGHRTVEPQAPGALADLAVPPWLTEEQQALWRDVIARAPAGLLRAADAELVVAYVELVDRHRRALQTEALIDRGRATPLLTRGPGGTAVESPYLQIMNRCALLLSRLAGELGLSPLARTRLARAGLPAGREDEGGDTDWGSLPVFPTIEAGPSGTKH